VFLCAVLCDPLWFNKLTTKDTKVDTKNTKDFFYSPVYRIENINTIYAEMTSMLNCLPLTPGEGDSEGEAVKKRFRDFYANKL
jgi:hypothetical protein